MATARKAVALALEAYELCLAAQAFQRGKELLGLFDAAAQILLTVNDEHGRVHLRHIRDRRIFHQMFEILPGSSPKFVVTKIPADIAGSIHRGQVGNTAVSDGGPEAIGMPHEPVCHEAAIAATSDAQTLLIDITPGDQRVHAGHDVQRVLLAPDPTHGKREFASIAATAARIGVEHHVALARLELHFVEEAIAVVGMRSAVNLQDQGIFFLPGQSRVA